MEEPYFSSSSAFVSATQSPISNGSQSPMPGLVNPRPFFSNTRNPDADKPESSKNASARHHASQCLSLGNYNRQLPTSEAVDEGSSADELSRLPFFIHTQKLDAERPESSKDAAARCHALQCPPLGHYDRQVTGSETLDQDSPVDELSNGGSSSFSLVSGYERRGWGFSGLDPMLISFAKLRCCDVYIGLHGRKSSLLRFVKWLRAELELHGVSCLVADRSRCNDAEQQRVVEKAMTAATLGVVIVTKRSFSNPFSIEELRFFLSKKNLVPIFFGLSSVDCLSRDVIEKQGELWEKYGGDLWLSYGGSEKEWKEAVDGLSRVGGELKLEAHAGNWRDCISQALILLGTRLGRKYMMERVKSWKERVKKEEFPFSRNRKFVGRKKELLDLELFLFGDIEGDGENECFELKTSHKKLYLRTGRGTENKGTVVESIDRVDKQHDDDKGKGFEPMVWKESEDEIEIEGLDSLPTHYLLPWGKNGSKNVKGKTSANVIYGKGIACVSGNSGIGKTELLLEFAYRFSQRYRMVLWIGGEARYICQNYMNLLSLLGVDLSDENELCPDGDGPRSLRELEEEAIRRVRKELMRDIPFLVVIDNLEDEKDWWSRKDIMDLLPRFGGETHVIISTRLPRILNLEPLRLSYLSGAEALSLMKGTLKDLPVAEMDALRVIEEKLGRITLGLTLVGAIFSELSISPGRLLETINAMPLRNLKWSGREDPVLRHNPFLVQLLDVCFLIFDHEEPPRSLATRMVLVSGWFAPSPIPVSVLALAAAEIMEDRRGNSLWKKCIHAVCCKCFTSYVEKSEAEASTMLVRFGVARGSTKHGCIQVHDIFKMYARKRGGITVASVMVRAINVYGSLPQDCAHIWAACFLLFRFGTDPAVVELNVTDLLSFTRRLALPLAILTYSTFFHYNSAKELLHQCIETLEAAEESLISHVEKGLEKPLCCTSADQWKKQLNPALYQEVALLKATLLETNAKLMLKGGDYDSAECLCRSVISIRKVLCGWDHSLTISAREIMDKIVRSQANI